jgi:hypothetical protein
VRFPPQALRFTTAGWIACSAREFIASIPATARKRELLVQVALQEGHQRIIDRMRFDRPYQPPQLVAQSPSHHQPPMVGEFALQPTVPSL